MLRSLDSSSRVSPRTAAWAANIVRTIYPQGTCRHTAWRLCERRQKKVTSFRIQCMACGRISSAIAKDYIHAAGVSTAALPAWDETLLSIKLEEQVRAESDRRLREEERWWKAYDAYLESDEWRRKRALVLKRSAGVCEGCGVRPAVQVHHLHYKRVFREMLFDLVAVCRQCHDAIHESDDDEK